MAPFYSPGQAILDSLAYISVGVIFLIFGLRVLRLYQKYRSPLTASFTGYNLVAGIGFTALGLTSFLERNNPMQYGALLCTPIFFVAVAYLSNFIWFVRAPASKSRPIFWLFCGLGLVELVAVILNLLGNTSLGLVVTYLPLAVVALVLVAGVVIVRYGTSKAAHLRALFIGGSLIASSVIATAIILFAGNPLLALSFDIALMIVQAIGLVGITWISKNEEPAPTPTAAVQ